MGNLTSTDLIIVLVLVAIVFILIGVIGILDFINKRKKQDMMELEKPEHDDQINLERQSEEKKPKIENSVMEEKNNNPSHVEEIKYVEEDEELEKTKAKIELAELKEELRRQEEMKKIEEEKKKEIKVEVAQESDVAKPKEEVRVEVQEKSRPEVSNIASAINEQLIKEETEEAKLAQAHAVQEDLNEILEIGIEERIANHEDEQEEKAIISVEQFKKVSEELYDSNEVIQNAYDDEGDEPISIAELENLCNKKEEKTVKMDDFNTVKLDTIEVDKQIKKLEDLPPIAMEKKFKSSPFISPVYGLNDNNKNLELEQTANLEKLNEELKKTNEFLKTLKELKKNLD